MSTSSFPPSQGMLTPLPPAAAYQRDAASHLNERPFGDDAFWLEIAALVARAAEGDVSDRATALREISRRTGESENGEYAEGADAGELTLLLSNRVSTIAEQIEEAGAFHLAFSLLSLWCEIADPVSPLEAGRARWLRTRILVKLGHLDAALEHYEHLDRMARTHGIGELEIRAWIGYAIVAQIRGNYPAMRRWHAAAAARAEAADLPELATIAHHGCMIGAATAGELNIALRHGWRAFVNTQPQSSKRSEALVNIAELLLRAGYFREAAAGFVSALSDSPSPRIALPALGGLARAAAAAGDLAQVGAAYTRLRRLLEGTELPYPGAQALFEAACAFAEVGDEDSATEARDLSLQIAERYGFHELLYRLEQLHVQSAGERCGQLFSLDADGEFVIGAVRELSAGQSRYASTTAHPAR